MPDVRDPVSLRAQIEKAEARLLELAVEYGCDDAVERGDSCAAAGRELCDGCFFVRVVDLIRQWTLLDAEPEPCANGHLWSSDCPSRGAWLCDCGALGRDADEFYEGADAEPEQGWQDMADAAEMLWVVLANVSGGDWTKQTPDWQEYAARWRDNYFEALKRAAPPRPSSSAAECEVSKASGRICRRGTFGCDVDHPRETSFLAAEEK